MKKFIYLLIPAIILISCSKKSSMEYSENTADYAVEENQNNQELVKLDVERKLIKEGTVEFETKSIELTKKRIYETSKKYKGYISSDRIYKGSDNIRNTITVRIPSDNFDKFLSDATKGVSRFEQKEIRVNDVTEEFLDISARLKTKKQLEQRYLDLLKKANNISDILKIEKEVGKLREEIESTEGRLKFLNDKVSFSTIEIIFFESTNEGTDFGQKFKNGLTNGWEYLIWFFVLLTNIWPFILIGITVAFGINLWDKKRKKK